MSDAYQDPEPGAQAGSGLPTLGRDPSNPPPPPTDGSGDDADRLIAAAARFDLEEDVLRWEREAAAPPTDSRRSGRLLHEIGALRESTNPREALRIFAQGLSVDPTLQANTWSLRRHFRARGQWLNLVRLLEAEVRFGVQPDPADRADLQVEKGRLLEDRMGQNSDAGQAYRAALELAPGHAPAGFALLALGLRTGVPDDAVAGLSALASGIDDADVRAVYAIEISRAMAGPLGSDGDADRIRDAAESLFKALSAGVSAAPLLAELDRLSLAADVSGLRERVLDAFDSRQGREGPPPLSQLTHVVALYREKARGLLRRGAREAALAVIERALKRAPDHPLLLADLVDISEEAGKTEVLGPALNGQGGAQLTGDDREGALLRRAEAASRAGAAAEALICLDSLAPKGRFFPLGVLARARLLAVLGDVDRLATHYADEGRRMASTGTTPEIRNEAAHWLVRGAVIRHEHVKEGPIAESLLREALGLVPGYAPAVELLQTVFAAGARWLELAELLEEDHAHTSDENRRQLLGAALRVLWRDILTDPRRAERWDSAETKTDGVPDVAFLVGRVEALGRSRIVADSANDGGDAGNQEVGARARVVELAEAFLRLSQRATGVRVAAALQIAAARTHESLGDKIRAGALLNEAARLDPGSAASALREPFLVGQALEESLRDELAAVEAQGARDVARALRFRLASLMMTANRAAEGLAFLEPLRADGDAFALGFSLQLARSSGQAALQLQVLDAMEAAELAADDGSSSGLTPAPIVGLLSRFERSRAHAEAREQLADPAAAAAFEMSAQTAAVPAPAVAVDAALGAFREHARHGGPTDLSGAARRVADLLQGWPAQAGARRAADLLAVLSGHPGPPAGGDQNGADGLRRWLAAIVSGNEAEAAFGLQVLAQSDPDAGFAKNLAAAMDVRRRLLRVPGALFAAPGVSSGVDKVSTLVATDLLGDDARDIRMQWRQIRIAALNRLGHTDTLLRQLYEAAWDAESTGQLRTAAAAYARILDHHPGAVEATEGFRRLSRAIGDRRNEAALLSRLGGLLFDPQRAAARFAEAALLLEEQGLPAEGARQFLAVLTRVPTDDEAYRRLKAILEFRDDGPGLERLIGFKIGHTTDPQARAALYAERAALRLERLMKRRDGITDLRHAIALDGTRVDSLVTLAQLANEAQRFSVAVDLFRRALDHETEAEKRAAIRRDLAASEEDAGLSDEAAATLLAAIAEATECAADASDVQDVHERMFALAVRRQDLSTAATQLMRLEALAVDAENRAVVRVRLGRMERDLGRDTDAAIRAFTRALEMDPLGEAAAELGRTVAPAAVGPLLSGVPGAVVARVFDEQKSILIDDPVDLRRLVCVRDLAGLVGDHHLYQATSQLLAVFGVGDTRGHVREPGRPLTQDILASLGPTADRAASEMMAAVWPLIAPGVPRFEDLDLAKLGATRGTRTVRGADARLGWVESTALSLGLANLTIHVSPEPSVDHAAIPVDGVDPILVLGRAMLAGDPAARFLVGRVLFLLAFRAGCLARQGLADSERMWAAAMAVAVPGQPVHDNTVKMGAKLLTKGLSRREIKALEAFGPRLTGVFLDVAAWRRWLLGGAGRFGLALAGDLAATLRIMTGQPAPTPEALRNPESLDLIRFALGDGLPLFRREAGMGEG